MTADWWTLDAVGLATAFRKGALDPVEVATDANRRAEDAGCVFIARTAERAVGEAEAARRRLRAGRPASPLDGVPLAWKDLFDMAGTVTTAGAAFRRTAPPAAADAPLVARLAEAGLVSVGKTNLSELAFSGLGLNPHFGTPPHPGIGGAVPGGSSSGSAVAVATAIVPLAFGSDTAGSVRVPAAFNGLYGYRPSVGRYALDGVVPLAPSFDTAGPFSRSLRDIVLLDAVLQGTTGSEREDGDGAPSRFVVDETLLGDDRISAPVRRGVEDVIGQFVRSGGVVERRRETVLAEVGRLLDRDGWLGGIEAYATHEALLGSAEAGQLDPFIRARLELAGRTGLATAVRLYQARDTFRRRLKTDEAGTVFLLPVVAHTPPRLPEVEAADDFRRVNAATLRLTMIGSFLGMPGLALPLREGTGLLATSADGTDRLLFGEAARISRLL